MRVEEAPQKQAFEFVLLGLTKKPRTMAGCKLLIFSGLYNQFFELCPFFSYVNRKVGGFVGGLLNSIKQAYLTRQIHWVHLGFFWPLPLV